MPEYAMIEVTVHRIPHGKTYETYRWIGKRNQLTYVNGRYYNDGVISKLPWPMHMIEYDFSRDAYLCVRTDTAFWFIPWVKHKLSDAHKWFWYRALATVKIWRSK